MNLFFYLFLSAVLLYLSVYYGSLPLTFLFLAQAFIPLFFMIPALISGLRTKLRLRSRSELWEAGNSLWLEAPKRGFFPLPHIRAIVRMENSLTGQLEPEAVDLLPAAGKAAQGKIPFAPQDCGLYRISVQGCRGHDYFHIFPLHIPREKQGLELFVMPRQYETQIHVSQYTRAFVVDSEHYHKEKSGEDFSETFGMRPYRPGDKMSRVHWKLTAKSEELMMKEGSLPIGNSVLLLADPNFLCPRLWDTVFSLSCGLLAAACPHYFCWLAESGALRRASIESREDLYALIPQLFRLAAAEPAIPIEEHYCREFRSEGYAAALRVAEGIYHNGKLLPGSENPERFLPAVTIEL